MKTFAKVAIGTLMACGIAVAAVAPAEAGVRFGVGIGVPAYAGYYGPPPCYAYGDPYCGYPGYYGPGFVGGYWGGGWGHGGFGGRGGFGGHGFSGGHGFGGHGGGHR
jgi:hypothetical protein